jgi:hypothetical protein
MNYASLQDENALTIDPWTLALQRWKMPGKTEIKQVICPFTLELLEDCCVRNNVDLQEMCFFTLESCCFEMTDHLHHSEVKKRSGRQTLRIYLKSSHEGNINIPVS